MKDNNLTNNPLTDNPLIDDGMKVAKKARDLGVKLMGIDEFKRYIS